MAKYALVDIGKIYWYGLNDEHSGERYLRKLIAQYPDDRLSIWALITLGEWDSSKKLPQKPLAQTATDLIPKEFELSQNYPNPFNPETTIRYAVPEAGHVTITVFNTLGQVVATLVDEQEPAGYHEVVWQGRDDTGIPVANGVYFYQIQAGNFIQMKKAILMK